MRRTLALTNTFAGAVPLVVALLGLAACAGGASGPPPTAVIFGSITGLAGSGLVLQNNGGSDLEIPSVAQTFLFSGLREGEAYRVTVKSQPTAATQTCIVNNGAGVAFEQVRTVSVACTTTPFVVRGSITGLTADGLTLRINGSETQSVPAGAASFAFLPVLSGASYTVTIGSQPSGQTCVLNNGNGVVGAAAVTNIIVSCTGGAGALTVGGTVVGLGADGLSLRLNGGPGQFIAAQVSSFTFPTAVQTGDDYSATVATTPSGPHKSCVLGNGKGRMGSSSVTNMVVRCFANSGLDSYTGTYAVLLNGRPSYLTLWFDGTFSFASRLDDPACANSGNGVEYGVYKRATSGAFSVLIATRDGNGTCGLWAGGAAPAPGAGYEGTMVRNGNTLTLASATDGSFTLLAVESVPASLVGSFTRTDGIDGSFIVFASDGTYLYQEAQQSGLNSATPAGYERGCYTVSGSTFTTSLSAACQPNGLPALDLNGAAGFSGKNGAAIPFAITSATTVTLGGVPYDRILPAG